jgi:hypothetical protein
MLCGGCQIIFYHEEHEEQKKRISNHGDTENTEKEEAEKYGTADERGSTQILVIPAKAGIH